MPPLFKSGNSRFRMNLPTSLLVYYLLGGEEWAQFLESVGKWPHLEKCRGMRHIEHRKALERYQLFAFSLIQMSIVHWQFHSKPNKKNLLSKAFKHFPLYLDFVIFLLFSCLIIHFFHWFCLPLCDYFAMVYNQFFGCCTDFLLCVCIFLLLRFSRGLLLFFQTFNML